MLLASYPVICLKVHRNFEKLTFIVMEPVVINIHLSSALTAYPTGRRIFDRTAEAISVECQSSNFC